MRFRQEHVRHMRLARNQSKQRVISLTPLIDVVFILLLFFMLSTQFTRQKAMALNIPAGNVPAASDADSSLTLHLSANGNIKFAGGDVVSLDSLATHADLLRAIDQETHIRLDADDAVPLQLLVSVTDRLERAGAGSVLLTALRQP